MVFLLPVWSQKKRRSSCLAQQLFDPTCQTEGLHQDLIFFEGFKFVVPHKLFEFERFKPSPKLVIEAVAKWTIFKTLAENFAEWFLGHGRIGKTSQTPRDKRNNGSDLVEIQGHGVDEWSDMFRGP